MTVLDEGMLRKLADWSTDGLLITSVYVNTDGRRYPSREQFYEELDAVLKAIDVEAIEDRESRYSVMKDLDRVRTYVKDEFQRSGHQSLAVFSASGAGLWEAIPLPRPARTAVDIGSRPHLLPIEAMVEQLETFVAVVADRERARIISVSMGHAEELMELQGDVPGQHDQGGWSQARFQRHIDEHLHRHLKAVADRLLELDRGRSFDHVVLAGTEELVAELERELHDYVARKVLARIHLPIAAGADDVLRQVQEIEAELEARREAEAVDRLVHEAEAGTGRVTAGIPGTLLALEEGRVDTLVVTPDIEASGVRCTSCGHLAVAGESCEVCGSATEPTDDLVEEMLEVALRRRCRVALVEPSPELEALGGLGALLRF